MTMAVTEASNMAATPEVTASLTWVDLVVIIVYFMFVIGVGVWVSFRDRCRGLGEFFFMFVIGVGVWVSFCDRCRGLG